MQEEGKAGLPSTAVAPARHGRRGRSIRTLASYLLTLFVLVTLNFFIPRAMPGDPVAALAAESSSNFVFGEPSRTALKRYYGLDHSLLHQYRHYLSGLVHGDLGRSISTNTAVLHEIGRRLPWTLLLIGSSIALSTGIGVVSGVHSGWRRDRPAHRALLTTLLAVREFPAYLLASLLLYLLAVKLTWLPLFGAQTPFSDSFSLTFEVLDVGRHLVLPLFVLTLGLTAGNYLVMRAAMVSELGADYLLLGRAKGLRERRLKYRYAARNALLPVVSVTALQLGFVVTGDVLIERVFAYPGLGGLIFEAIGSRDYPTIQGAFLFVSVSVVTVNALADALNRHLDPRTV